MRARSVEAMRVVRPWIAIPAIAVIAGAIGALCTRSALVAVAAGLLAAALASAIRAFAGSGAPAVVAATAGATLGVLGWLDLGGSARGGFAGAAAMFAICELVRPRVPIRGVIDSPWPAVGAGVVAAILDPSYAPLVAITAVSVVASPASRPRWVVVLPVIGAAVALAALLAACARGGALARLELAWSGHAAHRIDAIGMLRAAGIDSARSHRSPQSPGSFNARHVVESRRRRRSASSRSRRWTRSPVRPSGRRCRSSPRSVRESRSADWPRWSGFRSARHSSARPPGSCSSPCRRGRSWPDAEVRTA